MKKTFVLILVFGLFCTQILLAQLTISGKVIDKETKEPVPFVNIVAVSSNEGTSTDFDGNFTFHSLKNINELQFSFMGYETYKYKPSAKNVVDVVVELNPIGIQIEETVVVAKKNKNKIPKDTAAVSLQQKVVDHKDENRPSAFDSYSFKEHTKIEFDFYKPNPKFYTRKIFKPFSVMYDYIDSTENGVPYVPLLLQEKLSEIYYQKNPEKEKEIVLGQYLTGVQNISSMVIVDDIFDNFNLYDNIIIAGGKSFTSPFSVSGLMTYRYYLTDSLKENGHTYYRLDFTPKSKESIAFNGHAYIDGASFAIKSIEFALPQQANLNWIGEFVVEQRFTEVDSNKWILEGETIQIAVNPSGKKNARSLLVKKSMQRNAIEVNIPIDDKVFEGERLILDDSLGTRTRTWWEDNRVSTLTETEAGVIVMSDSIERTKAFKNYTWLGHLGSTAFIKAGPVEFGRFYQFVSWNSIEGIRPKFGMRTSTDFSKNLQLWGYLAYGTKDKQFKYYGNARIRIPAPNKNWSMLDLTYKKDFTFLGVPYEDQQFSHDNMFLSIMRGKNPLTKIMLLETISATYERQWINGYSTKIGFGTQTFYAVKDVFDFKHNNTDGSQIFYDKFNTFQIGIDQHIAFGQNWFENTFYRFESFSKYPVIDLSYRLGIKNLAGGDFNFHKLELNIKHRLSSKMGYTRYHLNGGIVFGDVPYPLMFLPMASPNLYYNFKAYQLMNEFEYAADKYASFWVEHHFDGAIFNRIPGINKLKLRLVLIGKTMIGGAKPSNLQIIELANGMRVPNKGYAELGFGIENIGQLLRVDCLWRLTQRNDPLVNHKFAVRIAIVPKL